MFTDLRDLIKRMSNPASISTLSEFLLQAQTQYIVFDLGRGIRKIDNQTFFEWENQQTPCQFPRQDNAWFCITFWKIIRIMIRQET